jgi:hypothetical protein
MECDAFLHRRCIAQSRKRDKGETLHFEFTLTITRRRSGFGFAGIGSDQTGTQLSKKIKPIFSEQKSALTSRYFKDKNL